MNSLPSALNSDQSRHTTGGNGKTKLLGSGTCERLTSALKVFIDDVSDVSKRIEYLVAKSMLRKIMMVNPMETERQT